MIVLDKNYRLENDSNNWVLIYEMEGDINPKTNKPTVSTDKWYCTSLTTALNRYVNESTKASETAEDLMVQLIRIQGEINSLQLNKKI